MNRVFYNAVFVTIFPTGLLFSENNPRCLFYLLCTESTPICHTNMKPDGVLLPNSCNMEPDELKLSCSVSYKGNIPPIVQWREVGSVNLTTKGVSCRHTGNSVTCHLTINAKFGLQDTSYVCETTRSSKTQHNCSSGLIRLICRWIYTSN